MLTSSARLVRLFAALSLVAVLSLTPSAASACTNSYGSGQVGYRGTVGFQTSGFQTFGPAFVQPSFFHQKFAPTHNQFHNTNFHKSFNVNKFGGSFRRSHK